MKKIYSDNEHSYLSWLLMHGFITFLMLPHILTSKDLSGSLKEWSIIIIIVSIIMAFDDMIKAKKKISLITHSLYNESKEIIIELQVILNELDLNDKLFHISLNHEVISYRIMFDMEYEENKENKYLKFSFYLPKKVLLTSDNSFWNLSIRQKGNNDESDISYHFSNFQLDSQIEKKLTSSFKKSIANAIFIENRLPYLSLSLKKLKKVPISVLNDIYITELNLSNNEISTIPYFLKELKYLKKINFRNNYIREIPTFFEEYKYLEEIDFGNNIIKKINLNFLKMEALTLLNISNNPKFIHMDNSFYLCNSKFRLSYRNTLLAKIITPVELILKRSRKKGEKNEENS